MRTVSGPTSQVVVAGAGLAGLAAALHLAGRGREVTVIERDATPGGRAGRMDVAGFRMDTGPTVLTMPGLVAETLAAVGENLTDRLDLIRLDPAYRAQFADGSELDMVILGSPHFSLAEFADLAPLVAGHCQGCHQDGGISPFSLQTYAQAKMWSPSFDAVLRSPEVQRDIAGSSGAGNENQTPANGHDDTDDKGA